MTSREFEALHRSARKSVGVLVYPVEKPLFLPPIQLVPDPLVRTGAEVAVEVTSEGSLQHFQFGKASFGGSDFTQSSGKSHSSSFTFNTVVDEVLDVTAPQPSLVR